MDRELEQKKSAERAVNIKEQILEFIDRFGYENGFAPTVREIGAAVGLRSTSSVQAHLDILERDGQIQKGSKARTIKILDERYSKKAGASVQIPVIYEFTESIYSHKNIAGYLTLPGHYVKDGLYAAAFTDHVSIHVDGIAPGDLLLVRLTDQVSGGQRALVRIKGINTLICCMAEKDIEQGSIVGNVAGIFRSFE